METKIRVLNATIEVFNEKGLKFTMDDIAVKLGMSKKTIYTIFKDKEELFFEMVSYLFGSVKEGEKRILENENLTTLEKIKAVLGVLPDKYQDIDFGKLYQLREKHPKIYAEVEKQLENGWENTIALLEQGMAEGVIRPIKIPILKTMFESVLEQFFSRDVLVINGISYKDALEEVVNILIDGITVG